VLIVAMLLAILAVVAPSRRVGADPFVPTDLSTVSPPEAPLTPIAPFVVVGSWNMADGHSETIFPAGAGVLAGGGLLVSWFNWSGGQGWIDRYSGDGEPIDRIQVAGGSHFDVTPSKQLLTSTGRFALTGTRLSTHPAGAPASAPDGTYYVATPTATNHYSAAGVLLGSFPSTEAFDVAVLPTGDLVYVNQPSGGPVLESTITVRSSTGVLLHSWVPPENAFSVAVDHLGRIHVGLNWVSTVAMYTADGDDLGTYGVGSGGDWMSDLAVSPTGEVYAVMSGAFSGVDNRVNRLIDPAIPIVDEATPNNGTTAGGAAITLRGAGFSGATDVLFGSKAATSFAVVSDLEILAVAPPVSGPSTVNVFVKTATGSSISARRSWYVYKAPAPPDPPTGTSATPDDGSATVAWVAPASDGGSAVTDYTATASPGGSVCTTTGALTCTVAGLTNGIPHTFTVTATNDVGDSVPSTASSPIRPTTCSATSTVHPFLDVATAFPFCSEIEWMSATEITTGYPDGTFRPTSSVTRQAMASFLYKFEGQPATTLTEPFFADVDEGNPFYPAIQWMAETGLSTGTPQPVGKPRFLPANPVSRQATALFLWRNAGAPDSGLAPAFFADVTGGTFFAAVQWMASSDLSAGTPNPPGKPLYLPADAVSRQAMAAFLYRYDDLP